MASEPELVAVVTDEMVEAAEAAIYPRHERGFLLKPLVDPIDMRAALEAVVPAALLAAEQRGRDAERVWQDISSAPRDATEILACRPDSSVFVCRWARMDELVSEPVLEAMEAKLSDFEGRFHDRDGWLDGSMAPTLWMSMPIAAAIRKGDAT